MALAPLASAPSGSFVFILQDGANSTKNTNTEPINVLNSSSEPISSNQNGVSIDKNVIIGITIFWVFLAIITIVIGACACRHIRRQREREEERRQHRAREEQTLPPLKPGPLPIVVVLPNDEVAFGWKLEHASTDIDSMKDVDAQDSRCSSFKDHDEKHGSSSNLQRMA